MPRISVDDILRDSSGESADPLFEMGREIAGRNISEEEMYRLVYIVMLRFAKTSQDNASKTVTLALLTEQIKEAVRAGVELGIGLAISNEWQ